MPIYEVNIQGKTYEVDSPAELTDQQAYRAVLRDLDAKVASTQKDLDEYEAPDPTADMNAGEKLLAGIGSGLTDISRKATNLLLPESMEPDWAKSEAIHKQAEEDKALLNDGWGLAGNIVGSTAATLPATAPVGVAMRGAAGAMRAGSRLAKALRATPVTGAAEGAVAGAVMGNPDDRGDSAELGAVIGGAVPVLGKALKRVGAKGIVSMTPESRILQKQGIDVPIAQGAKHGLAKTIYRDWLPAMPLGGARLIKQSQKAFQQWRDKVAEQTLPKWAQKDAAKYIDTTSTQNTMRKIVDFWDNVAYADINPKVFHTDRKWMTQTARKLYDGANPEARTFFQQQLAQLRNKQGLVTGRDLMTLRMKLSEKAGSYKGDVLDMKESLYKLSDVVEGMMERQLKVGKPGSKSHQIFQRWQENKPAYARYLDMRKAAKKETGDFMEYSPRDMSTASAARTTEPKGVSGRGAMQNVGQIGQKGLGDPLDKPSLWRGIATLGLVGGTAALSSVPAAMVTFGGLRAAGNPAVQKILSGSYVGQRKLAAALHKNRDKLRKLGTVGRTALIDYGED